MRYLIDERNQLVLPDQYDEEGGRYVQGGDDPRRGEHRRAHAVADPSPRHAVHFGSLDSEMLILEDFSTRHSNQNPFNHTRWLVLYFFGILLH